MLFKLAITFALVGAEKAPAEKHVDDWYKSTTNLFEYCLQKHFQHPVCPELRAAKTPKSENLISLPKGDLTGENLLKATALYREGKAPLPWLMGLKLATERPSKIDKRLWAEAQYLYAQILFDQRKYQESSLLFDRAVEELKMRPLYHQERAWAQFFSGQFDRALGSVVSSESPLIYSIPNFDKYFLIALVERETCRWSEAFKTIQKGREFFKTAKPEVEKQPWVIACDQRKLGPLCDDLRTYYKNYFKAQARKALDDLDLLEIEMKDHRAGKQLADASSDIIWPFIGENWADELGYHSVPVGSQCG